MSVLDLEAYRERLQRMRNNILERLRFVTERIERSEAPEVGTNSIALRTIARDLEELERDAQIPC